MLASRIEALVFHRGWPFHLARMLGRQPSVRTVEHRVLVDPGHHALPPLKLAYASDFHAGPTTDPTVLQLACRALREARPDVVLLGGDFVSLRPSDVDALARQIGEIPAPFGRYAVLGNHDWESDANHIVRRLEDAGVQVLTNRNVRLKPPFGRVWICGVDDHSRGRPDGVAALAGADGVRVVLMHAPSGLLDVGEGRFELALCGHTHGGQLALPGGIPIVLPHGRLSRRYARGRFELAGGGTLIVSVGVGCVVLPLRLFAAPEIVVCSLESRQPDDGGT